MKDKLLQIRVDDDFLSKLEYLQKINGYKTIAETVRKIVEKEFRKELDSMAEDWKDGLRYAIQAIQNQLGDVYLPQ